MYAAASKLSKEDRLFLPPCQAAQGKNRSLTLCNRHLSYIPNHVASLSHLTTLNVRNNAIAELPPAIGELRKLTALDIGNNELSCLPTCLTACTLLAELRVGGNPLYSLDPVVIGSFEDLRILNIGACQLTELPATVGRLKSLEVLHLECNFVQYLPSEIGDAVNLREICASHNRLKRLPGSIGNLSRLTSLNVAQNQLRKIPRTIGKCTKLARLNVVLNQIASFPVEIMHLPLQQIDYTDNPLVRSVPRLEVGKTLDVLPLKEMTARLVLDDVRRRKYKARRLERENLDLYTLLTTATECGVCKTYFVTYCVECVMFMDLLAVFPKSGIKGNIPVQLLVCSRKCFFQQSSATPHYALLKPRGGIGEDDH